MRFDVAFIFPDNFLLLLNKIAVSYYFDNQLLLYILHSYSNGTSSFDYKY